MITALMCCFTWVLRDTILSVAFVGYFVISACIYFFSRVLCNY